MTLEPPIERLPFQGPIDTTPIVLEGKRVRLEPLSSQHLPELSEIAFEPSIWRWTKSRVTNQEEFRAFFDTSTAEMRQGTAIVWVTRSKADGKLAGSTRLFEISQDHRIMELGGTWLHPNYQRTGINVEAKYLQLGHAFETMNANRVAFKTHHENLKSQTAIAALGAKHEGTFRNHMIMPDGSIRHSVWYSITREEWPQVKAHLQRRLASYETQ